MNHNSLKEVVEYFRRKMVAKHHNRFDTKNALRFLEFISLSIEISKSKLQNSHETLRSGKRIITLQFYLFIQG